MLFFIQEELFLTNLSESNTNEVLQQFDCHKVKNGHLLPQVKTAYKLVFLKP
jgi:hypothetical protein